MLQLTNKRCLIPAAALALASALTGSALAQAAGTVDTLGGIGAPGYRDGVKGSSEFRSPNALAVRPDGLLFIADTENNLVRTLRPLDTQTRTFKPADGNMSVYNRPIGIAFDSKTNVYVANQGNGTIVKLDYFGNYRDTYTPALNAGPITGLAIDRGGNLYVAELNGVVLRLNTNGVVDAQFQAPAQGVHEFRGVAVTDDGAVYASDAATHVIWKFVDGAGGIFAGTYNQSGMANGEPNFGRLNRPHQIAAGLNNSIVVADRGNHRIRVISCDGVINTMYGVDPSNWYSEPGLLVFPGWWDSTAEFAEVRDPVGVAVDRAGTVYDTEVYYHLIRAGRNLQFPLACNNSTTAPPPSTNTPPAIVISPSSGFYPKGVKIMITASNSVGIFTRDTRLFYNLNGVDPTLSDTEILIGADGKAELVLPGPIDLANLRVRAFLGEIGGPTKQAGKTQVPTLKMSPDSGYYPMGVDVVVTSTNDFPEGTLLYYTDDGTVPTTNSTSLPHDGKRAVLGWFKNSQDLRSLKVRAFLGPNEGETIAGRAVSFPGEPEIQGEVGIPPARNGFRAGIGSYYILPIIANLRDKQILQSLLLKVELMALPGSPRLEATDVEILPVSTNDFIRVLPASDLPPERPARFAANGTNTIVLTFSGTNSGFNVTAGYATIALLGIQFRAEDALGNTAEVGDEYRISVKEVSGTSDGIRTLLPLKAMEDRIIRFENIRFREGDASPAYWYNAGDFGDDDLGNDDQNSAILAALGFLRPFPLSDAFAAMDVYRIGVLENVIEYSDAAIIVRRAVNIESPSHFRIRNEFGEWERIRAAAGVLQRNSVRALATDAPVWHRDVTIRGGVVGEVRAIDVVRVPVIMEAKAGAAVFGMQFVADVVSVNGAPEVTGVKFVPFHGTPAPDRYGSSVEGLGTFPRTVYARWSNLDVPLTGTNLLGYIEFVTPTIFAGNQHYSINFRETGGATIDPVTFALKGYLFESVHGEVWLWRPAPQIPQVSDDWKVHFFGISDGSVQEETDADNDGFSNVEEYVAGSNPTVPDWQVRINDGHLTFRWVGRAGQSYRVERTQDFNNWSAVGGPIAGQDAFLEYNELSSSGRAHFYRLNVQ